MRALLYKSTAIAVTALFLGFGVAAATSTPAEAAGWHHGYWGGGWWGPGIGLGILGLAAGAAIASQPYYGPGPYYGYGPGPDGCAAYQPVYDRWGRYLGRRWVDVCQ
jgi:hypothetical protein